MKITKTASGKTKIVLTKSEWKTIGKKAGWDDDVSELARDLNSEREVIKALRKNIDFCIKRIALFERKLENEEETPEQREKYRKLIIMYGSRINEYKNKLELFHTKDPQEWDVLDTFEDDKLPERPFKNNLPSWDLESEDEKERDSLRRFKDMI